MPAWWWLCWWTEAVSAPWRQNGGDVGWVGGGWRGGGRCWRNLIERWEPIKEWGRACIVDTPPRPPGRQRPKKKREKDERKKEENPNKRESDAIHLCFCSFCCSHYSSFCASSQFKVVDILFKLSKTKRQKNWSWIFSTRRNIQLEGFNPWNLRILSENKFKLNCLVFC